MVKLQGSKNPTPRQVVHILFDFFAHFSFKKKCFNLSGSGGHKKTVFSYEETMVNIENWGLAVQQQK